jgi:hypothetical protein
MAVRAHGTAARQSCHPSSFPVEMEWPADDASPAAVSPKDASSRVLASPASANGLNNGYDWTLTVQFVYATRISLKIVPIIVPLVRSYIFFHPKASSSFVQPVHRLLCFTGYVFWNKGTMCGWIGIFFFPRNIGRCSHIRVYTHLYERTLAHPTSISTSERLSPRNWFNGFWDWRSHHGRLAIDGNVASH